MKNKHRYQHQNTFLRESLVAIVNELISRSGNLKAAFSYKHNDF